MTQTEKRKILQRLRTFKHTLSEFETNAKESGSSWDQGRWTMHYQKVRDLKHLIATESRLLPIY